jgi:hypothetical protein
MKVIRMPDIYLGTEGQIVMERGEFDLEGEDFDPGVLLGDILEAMLHGKEE